MCHQTVCLIAEALELAGIPTVIAGTMRAPLAGMPRVLITGFDRGNNFGPPGDEATHAALVTDALELFTAAEPTVLSRRSAAASPA